MNQGKKRNRLAAFISSVLSSNTPEVNFLLLLAAITYFVIVVDLDSDYAVEKDEIEHVIATLTHSINTLTIDAHSLFLIEPPCSCFIPPIKVHIHGNDYRETPRDRSPPFLNSI